jgi:hypothetical protein
MFLLATKQFIGIFALTSDVMVNYSNIYAEEERLINPVVTINRPVEDLLIFDLKLLMIKAESGIGKFIWLLAKDMVAHWSLL